MDTRAIASEIVFLKNRLQELDQGPGEDPAERQRLRERMRVLQDHLADGTELSENKVPDNQADKVQFIPPA